MKNLLFLLILSGMITPLSAQETVFSRTYGGPGYNDARGIVKTSDGCFVFTGLNKSSADPEGDMYLTKINSAGAVLWEYFYGQPKEDGGNFLLPLRDGGFLISGHIVAGQEDECDGYLVRTDANGKEKWRLFVGSALDEICHGAVEMDDGSFFVTGRVEEYPESHHFDMMFCKISSDGNLIFLKTIPGNDSEFGFKIARAADGNILIAGYVDGGYSGEDLYLVKCDMVGNLLWKNRLDLGQHERAYGLFPLPKGGCLVTGGAASETYYQGSQTMLIAEVAEDGTFTKTQTLLKDTGNGYLFDICATGENGYAVAGKLKKKDADYAQPCLVLLDENLNLKNFHVVQSEGESLAKSLVRSQNGDFILAGKTAENEENARILISKISMDGNPLSANEVKFQPYWLFPNPFSDFTYLRLNNPAPTNVLTLFDNKGQLQRTIRFEGSELFLYRETLPGGIYYFQITNAEGDILTAGKLMIQ
ncbi:MAG: T9SS C-terminal target domain-containing protein [Bacteroidetes bacterium]|nr:MAG: T9SS C-terminal target domain-containing protein [Bacteroidota bacterium]